MADPCVCESNLEVTDEGELCAIPGAIGLREIVVFNSSDTFDKATYPWLARVHVLVVGGGGGGGGAEATTIGEAAAGSGGAGGGAAEVIVDVSALAASETVTVGAGGTAGAGAAGGDGGDSSFGAHAVAEGGEGGDLGTATSATSFGGTSAGGQGTTGDVLYQGGDGDPGVSSYAGSDAPQRFTVAGSGGGSRVCGRTADRIFSDGGSAVANSGRGGNGASQAEGAAASAGRAGGSGVVICWLYA